MGKRGAAPSSGRRQSKRTTRASIERAVDAVDAALRDPELAAALAQARSDRGARGAAALNGAAVGRLLLASAALGEVRPPLGAKPKRRGAMPDKTPLGRLGALAARVRACDGRRARVKALMKELSARESGFNAADIATVAFDVTGNRSRTKREALAAIEAWLLRR